MRNIPLAFVTEDAIHLTETAMQRIADYERAERESSVAERPRKGLRAFWQRVITTLDRNFDCDGPASLARFERAMRGTRSLAK